MPAINLNAAVNTVTSTATNVATSTVSNAVGNAVGTVTNGINSTANTALNNVSGSLNTNLGDLAGDLAGGLVGGAIGNALGGTAGGLIGGAIGSVVGDLIEGDETFQSILADPIRIVERGAAELLGLTGGNFDSVVQSYNDLKDRTGFGDDFVDSGWKSPFSASGKSASRIPNPLRNHNSYNYIITLGVLSAEEYNNPNSYRSGSGGFKKIILKSGGGSLDKRYQVFDEVGADGSVSEHAEYYIDDIDLEAVIAPNPNTGVAMGTNLSFTVTEPFSMGNFVEAIIGIARETGYQNYLDAPFCLKFDFVGWNEGGQNAANFLQRPIFIPIKFTMIDFAVSGTGSVYSVRAVPMSESGLSDNISKIKTPIKATGTLVHEVLETSVSSVTGGMNAQIEALEESEAISGYDRYVITFPKTRRSLVEALGANVVEESAFTTTVEEAIAQQKGSTQPLDGSTYQADKLNNVSVSPANSTYAILKTYAEDEEQMNEIGLSPINTSTNVGGAQQEAEPAAAIDPDTGKVDASSQAAQAADKARDYQFGQGEKITKIIEKIVNQSDYAAEKSTEGSKNGLNKWYKIDTQVFIDDNADTEFQMGRPPKVYVYCVVPYEVDEAHVLSTNQKPANTEGLKKAAAKEYNYIYTGKNEDVLNFDINFNQAFMQTALSNFGMNKGGMQTDNHKTSTAITDVETGATPPKETDISQKTEAGAPVEQAATLATESGGTVNPDIRRQIAEMFHDRITNMPLDMVTAEMEIIGDPFFIPQETGNYVAEQGSLPNATDDGTMTYQQAEVFCVVNFKTPFDYQVKGATMEMPQIVAGFSGLFSVWAVTNRFSRGQFTQTLKLIRRRGQDDPATTNNKGFIETNPDANIKEKPITLEGDPGNPNPPILPEGDAYDNAVCKSSEKRTFGFDDITKLIPALDFDIPEIPIDIIPSNLLDIEIPDLSAFGANLPNFDEIASQVTAFDVSALAPAVPAVPAVPSIPGLPTPSIPATVADAIDTAISSVSSSVGSGSITGPIGATGFGGVWQGGANPVTSGATGASTSLTQNTDGSVTVSSTNAAGQTIGFTGNSANFQINGQPLEPPAVSFGPANPNTTNLVSVPGGGSITGSPPDPVSEIPNPAEIANPALEETESNDGLTFGGIGSISGLYGPTTR